MSTVATGERLHALDHLRTLAMLAGVLFHAALAHSVLMQPFWPTAMGTHSWAVDALAWLSHLVRMPLFFLVAGCFAARIVADRGTAGLMRQRLRRVVVPFIVAWPLVTLAMMAGIGWATAHVEAPNAALRMIKAAAAAPDAPSAPLGTGHLWFLYYLALFAVMHWAGRVLGAGRALEAVLARGPFALALLLPALLVVPFALTSAPHPAPEGLLPQLWAIGVYGPFYVLGIALHGRLEWLMPLQRAWWPALSIVLMVHAAFAWQLWRGPGDAFWPRAAWSIAVPEAVVAGWGTLLVLLAGLRWLRRPTPLSDYLARSSYTVYLVHLPLVFALQFALMDLGLPGPPAFALVVAGTLAAGIALYEFGVRRTPLRAWIG